MASKTSTGIQYNERTMNGIININAETITTDSISADFISANNLLEADKTETITAKWTYTLPPNILQLPADNNDAANKEYVDNAVASIDLTDYQLTSTNTLANMLPRGTSAGNNSITNIASLGLDVNLQDATTIIPNKITNFQYFSNVDNKLNIDNTDGNSLISIERYQQNAPVLYQQLLLELNSITGYDVNTLPLAINSVNGVKINAFGQNFTFLTSGGLQFPDNSIQSTAFDAGNFITNPNPTDIVANEITLGKGGGNDPFSTALGKEALFSNISGISNTAVGYLSSRNATTASNNVAIGANSLRDNISASLNTAVGSGSLTKTTARRNTGVGASTLAQNLTGERNTAVGYTAGFDNSSGDDNVYIGDNGANFQFGDRNILVGTFINTNNSSANNNIGIGNTINFNNLTNSICIGNNITTTGDNQIRIGGVGTSLYAPSGYTPTAPEMIATKAYVDSGSGGPNPTFDTITINSTIYTTAIGDFTNQNLQTIGIWSQNFTAIGANTARILTRGTLNPNGFPEQVGYYTCAEINMMRCGGDYDLDNVYTPSNIPSGTEPPMPYWIIHRDYQDYFSGGGLYKALSQTNVGNTSVDGENIRIKQKGNTMLLLWNPTGFARQLNLYGRVVIENGESSVSSLWMGVGSYINTEKIYITTNPATSTEGVNLGYADATYQTIADMSNYLTTASAGLIYATISSLSNYYTKLESDALYYSQTFIDNTFQTIANMSNYYTKVESDNLFTKPKQMSQWRIRTTNSSNLTLTTLNNAGSRIFGTGGLDCSTGTSFIAGDIPETDSLSAWNNTTGTFTCPTTGMYRMDIRITINPTNTPRTGIAFFNQLTGFEYLKMDNEKTNVHGTKQTYSLSSIFYASAGIQAYVRSVNLGFADQLTLFTAYHTSEFRITRLT